MTTDTQSSSSRDIIRQLFVLLSVVATIVINVLANALPLNGQNTGEISDRYPTYFVPAGYVFAVWFVIYVGLIAYGVYQALPAQRQNPDLRAIGLPFIIGSLANIAWIFLWHYEYLPLTLLAMVILLLSLIFIYWRLGVGLKPVSSSEKWFVHVPFSLYLAWISVATIANASNLLYDLNWNGFGISGPTWAAIMLVVATALTLAIIWQRADVAFTAVIVWAFAGIIVKQSGTTVVTLTAGIMIAIVVLALLARLFWFKPQSLQPAA